MMRSCDSLKRSRLKAGLLFAAMFSTPPPRTNPETSRPFDIRSIMASSSAMRTGSSDRGSGLPSMTSLTRSVTAASAAPMMFALVDMENGALWCSLSMIPSTPISSA